MRPRTPRAAAAAALGLSLALGLTLTPVPVRAGLDEYVKKADPAYAWSVVETARTPMGTVHHLKLRSQVWKSIPWDHQFRIHEPAELKYPDAVLLFITGGSTDAKYNPRQDGGLGFALADLCGARVAVLPQVPNQPLLDDKKEDTLIAETFVRYLETGDAEWPLLFPMVKSAVRAMDTVQAWARQQGLPEVKRFVVSGASKRGWTTWLTGASDPRVVAIAPMVIDTLNMKAQKAHSLEVWGKFSEQIDDYTSRGLTEKFDDPKGKVLWQMVDPYSYLDRLTMPKLLINGTNDRYWTLDALNIYWDDLKGPKSVVYLPNAGHGLEQNRNYALNGVAALFRHTVSGRPWPKVSWEHRAGDGGALRLTVQAEPAPRSAKLWSATADTRDFRESRWEPTPMNVSGGVARGEVPRPGKGFVAVVGDVEFEIDGLPFHLSTQVLQTGAKGAE